MISIFNRQRSISISQHQIKDICRQILKILSYENASLSILITTNRGIRKFNKQFLGKDSPTDILSFPTFNPKELASQHKSAKGLYLGDIIISAERVLRDTQKIIASGIDIDFETWLNRLFVHGICHLVGYDHETEKDFKKMNAKEQEILSLLGTSVPLYPII
ncbi:MAG: rRNA maturation RNase YbeY [Candidatus Babeliaceae bacterium]|nr:rRNA maturation RNase YbeY [Candidatus Babeliaceae bacterium]